MPGIINSAPDCITHAAGSKSARVDDTADFILQNNFQDCAGFGTFRPGSTYGEDGSGAESLYMILTWVGIVVMLVVLVAWVLYENRQLIQACRIRRRPSPDERTTAPARRSGRQPMTNHGSGRSRSSSRRCRLTSRASSRDACDLDPLCHRGPGDRAVHEHREQSSVQPSKPPTPAVTPSAQAEVGRWGTPRTARGPTWLRAGVIVSVLLLAFVAAADLPEVLDPPRQGPGDRQGTEQVDFAPRRTQIRLLRQGMQLQALLDRLAVEARQGRGHVQRARGGSDRRQHRKGRKRQAAGKRRAALSAHQPSAGTRTARPSSSRARPRPRAPAAHPARRAEPLDRPAGRAGPPARPGPPSCPPRGHRPGRRHRPSRACAPWA